MDLESYINKSTTTTGGIGRGGGRGGGGEIEDEDEMVEEIGAAEEQVLKRWVRAGQRTSSLLNYCLDERTRRLSYTCSSRCSLYTEGGLGNHGIE